MNTSLLFRSVQRRIKGLLLILLFSFALKASSQEILRLRNGDEFKIHLVEVCDAGIYYRIPPAQDLHYCEKGKVLVLVMKDRSKLRFPLVIASKRKPKKSANVTDQHYTLATKLKNKVISVENKINGRQDNVSNDTIHQIRKDSLRTDSSAKIIPLILPIALDSLKHNKAIMENCHNFMYDKGFHDAEEHYHAKRPEITSLLCTSLSIPVGVGTLFTMRSIKPGINDLNAPDLKLLEDPDYLKGYRELAFARKKSKVLKGFYIGIGIDIALTTGLYFIAKNNPGSGSGGGGQSHHGGHH